MSRFPAFALCRGHDIINIMKTYEFEITTLASVSSLKVLVGNDMAPPGCAEDIVNKNLTYLKLDGTLDAETEYESQYLLTRENPTEFIIDEAAQDMARMLHEVSGAYEIYLVGAQKEAIPIIYWKMILFIIVISLGGQFWIMYAKKIMIVKLNLQFSSAATTYALLDTFHQDSMKNIRKQSIISKIVYTDIAISVED
ncbi:hypothetical protein OPV22_003815 [Ensete ventricosum]|uniref:Uncharacterized protein n=1 Tax=Ensete ventricosum TaxID=4639 RepID=A0AAV8S207_ENSVE|nr:hypothetical protein OPV22_003815 [Ensete ventricosum]